ncbi:MAG: adenylosuccinate lyase [Candidatus Dormibacteria bacterium]
MIDRYAPRELRALWSEESRLGLWTRVEQAVCRARAQLGEISEAEASAIDAARPPGLERVMQLEAEQGHDLAAFVTALQEQLGDEGRQVHLGLTSQDVVDTALALQLKQAQAFLDRELEALSQALADLGGRHLRTPMIGRTHGMHAEPVTFGFVLANHLDEVRRSRRRLDLAAADVVVGKISGTVGTHATVSAEVEELALAELGLRPAAITTQVVARDRHAAYLCQLALTGSVLERLATNLRHLQRTEIGELREPFGTRQKGSSAMPHKRNPVRLEQICGLSRVLRGLMVAGMEDVALWHERDISHSSVERVALPDATMALGHMLRSLTEVVGGLEVDTAAMAANLERRGSVARSQQVLLRLVSHGMAREEAYRLVQRLAHQADRPGGDFRALCLTSPELLDRLGEEEVAQALGLEQYLAGIDASFTRLGLLAPEPAHPAGDAG